MRNLSKTTIVGLAGVFFFASCVAAQNKQQTEPPPPLREGSASILDKLVNEGTGGAAPKRDLTGFWGSSVGQKINQIPPMTPWGEQVFRTQIGRASCRERV